MTQTNKNPEWTSGSQTDAASQPEQENSEVRPPRRSRLARSEKTQSRLEQAPGSETTMIRSLLAQDGASSASSSAPVAKTDESEKEAPAASARKEAARFSDEEIAALEDALLEKAQEDEPVVPVKAASSFDETPSQTVRSSFDETEDQAEDTSQPLDEDELEQSDLFNKDLHPLDGSKPRPRRRPARSSSRRSMIVPAVLLTLALAGGSFGAAWFFGTQGAGSELSKLNVTEQKQYDEYVAWLESVPKPEQWSEETFVAIKTAALNAYDRTQLDQIAQALEGNTEAKEALKGKKDASDQTALADYKSLLENASAYPQDLVAAAVSDPGLLHFVLEYPKYASSQGQDVPLASVSEIADLKTFDPNWGYMPYGNSIFALTGAAPTAISDIFSYLRDDPALTPYAVGNWARQFGYDVSPIRETDDSIFGGAALTWGVSMNPVPAYKTQINSYLEQGYPMIIATGSLEAPQFFVLTGLDENGNWKAHNPLSSNSPLTLVPEETADQLVKAYAFW